MPPPIPERGFVPIPASAEAVRPSAGEEGVDLGDDLLEGPTRIFTQPSGAEKTEHLLREIKQDLKETASARLDIDMLMKKAERYTAKRNYYLARKALRHAQALGADAPLRIELLGSVAPGQLLQELFTVDSVHIV